MDTYYMINDVLKTGNNEFSFGFLTRLNGFHHRHVIIITTLQDYSLC